MEVGSPEGEGRKVQLRGTGPGSNPDAVRAFRAMAATDKADDERIRAIIVDAEAAGLPLRWSARAPGDLEG